MYPTLFSQSISKKNTKILLLIIGLLSINTYSKSVSNFCPLELHNKWKYSIYQSGPYTYCCVNEGTRQIEIVDTINRSESRLIVFSVIDSVSDSIYKFQDTLIDKSYGLTYYCSDSICSKSDPGGLFNMRITSLLRDRHQYPDSLLTKVQWNGDSLYCLYQHAWYRLSADTSLSIENVGLVYECGFAGTGGHSYSESKIVLTFYNNDTLIISDLFKSIAEVPSSTFKPVKRRNEDKLHSSKYQLYLSFTHRRIDTKDYVVDLLGKRNTNIKQNTAIYIKKIKEFR
jgi:hypothetical protein